MTTTGVGQKLVVLQQRAQTPVASISGNAVQQSLGSQQQQIKITQSVSGTQKTLASGQKLVVVCMSNSSAGTTTISQVIFSYIAS